MDMKQKQQKVAILGAGVSGVAMAGALQDYRIEFVVFDKKDKAGGLWADNYPGAKVQSTVELYEYPCKKFPKDIRKRSDPPAPTAAEVCTYLEEYIQEKNMAEKFRFNKTISDIVCIAEDHWVIEFDDFTSEEFTFVVLCNGLVSSKPNMIDIPGLGKFKANGGTVLHSSERRSNEILAGKRVLVVGNGKSAVDTAIAAADCNPDSSNAPIQLARRQTWYIPRYLLGVLQYKWAFHTRIGSALLPRYYETTFFLWTFLHLLFIPIKWALWRLLELLLLMQYRLPYAVWPSLGTIEGAVLETSVLITDESHLGRVRKGDIDMRVGEIERLEPGKAILSNGRDEVVDVIVMATGWQLAYDQFINIDHGIFAGLDFEKDSLDFCDDGLWLYRNVLPAGFKGMAFVGANTLTFINIFTSYTQAYWLAQLLAGERQWPEEEHMKTTVEREKAFKRHYYKPGQMRAASIEAYMQHYHDLLFCEMKAKSPYSWFIRPITHLLVPMAPSVMKGCLEPPTRDDAVVEKKEEKEGASTQPGSATIDEDYSGSEVQNIGIEDCVSV